MLLCKYEEKFVKNQPFSENLKVVGDAQPAQVAPQLHLLGLHTSSWWGIFHWLLLQDFAKDSTICFMIWLWQFLAMLVLNDMK